MDKMWKSATSPNYETNEDKLYPYSELPNLNEYKLIKIPYCIKNLIDHVDYFGLGRMETIKGFVGFPNSYNVNYEYYLIPSGKDKGRKIPNRIPISEMSDMPNNYTYYYSSDYIKDNSVLTVTYTPYYNNGLTDLVAKDIARIVNGHSGKVIVYGLNFNDNSQDKQILTISDELKKIKQLFYCPIYMLPDNLQQTHYKTSYRVYLSLNELKKELYNNVKKGEYEAAIILTACLTDVYCFNALSEVVTKLLKNRVVNVIVYAYKLWTNNAKYIICKYFPTIFKLMFNSENVTIVNQKYNQALMIESSKEMLARGSHNKTSSRVKWQILPTWDNITLSFKLRNVDSNLYLNLYTDNNNSKVACGLKDSTKITELFYFEPLMTDDQVVFIIINSFFEDRLHMDTTLDSENKPILGGKDNVYKDEYLWIIAPCKIDENDDDEENAHNCIRSIGSLKI